MSAVSFILTPLPDLPGAVPHGSRGVTRGEGASPLVAVAPRVPWLFVEGRNAHSLGDNRYRNVPVGGASYTRVGRPSQGRDARFTYHSRCEPRTVIRPLTGPCAPDHPARNRRWDVPVRINARSDGATTRGVPPIAQVTSEVQEHMEIAEALNDVLRRLHQRYPHDAELGRAFALSNLDVENHNDAVMKSAINLAWEKGGIRALRNPRSRLNQLVREGGGYEEEEPQIA